MLRALLSEVSPKMRIQYIALRHCPDVQSSSGRRIGVIYRFSGVSDSPLETWLIPDWEDGVSEEHADFIRDVFDDPSLKTSDEISAIFDSLARAVHGPLQTEQAGFCDESEIKELLPAPQAR